MPHALIFLAECKHVTVLLAQAARQGPAGACSAQQSHTDGGNAWSYHFVPTVCGCGSSTCRASSTDGRSSSATATASTGTSSKEFAKGKPQRLGQRGTSPGAVPRKLLHESATCQLPACARPQWAPLHCIVPDAEHSVHEQRARSSSALMCRPFSRTAGRQTCRPAHGATLCELCQPAVQVGMP